MTRHQTHAPAGLAHGSGEGANRRADRRGPGGARNGGTVALTGRLSLGRVSESCDSAHADVLAIVFDVVTILALR